MIEFIKAKSHKGITEVKLHDLGCVNVICGKNSSGKTSILEAITDPQKYALGKRINDLDLLQKEFEQRTNGLEVTLRTLSRAWFKIHISNLQGKNTVWFFDEIDGIAKELADETRKVQDLNRYSPKDLPFRAVVQQYIISEMNMYRPILIPPQRKLETKNNIAMNQSVQPSGSGILNRLFYLKNQDIESDEYATFLEIYKAFAEITAHTFNIIPNPANSITIYFKMDGDDWIESDSCGQGLSDILVIVTFTLDFDYSFILIEEPESHIHPDMQRKLLRFLCKNTDKQFLLSTHSNIFLDNAIVDRVFLSSFKDTVEVDEATNRSSVLFELGYSVTDNLVSDLVILVEGPSDRHVVQEFLKKMGLYEQYNIKIWPLGGDIMDQSDLSVFAEKYNILALIDKDPGSNTVRKRFIANCKQYAIPVTRLRRYSIENYFSVAALKSEYGAQIPASFTL